MDKKLSIRNLKVLDTVCQEKNMTKAAKQLDISQPAASLAVREMEEYTGTTLFERDGRGMRLTKAARHFYPMVQQLLKLYGEMENEMMKWSSTSSVHIGSSISIGACILPSVIRKYNQNYPEIEVKVSINSSDIIEQAILNGDLDIALIEGSIHSDKIVSECFLKDELVAICGMFHPLAGKKQVPIDRLQNEKFLFREKNSGTRELIETVFSQKDFFFEPMWESTSTTALINAVAQGIGISILPKKMLQDQLDNHKVYSFSIEGIDLSRNYYVIYQKKRLMTVPVEHFLSMVRNWQDEHN